MDSSTELCRAAGFPRIGEKREVKKALERYACCYCSLMSMACSSGAGNPEPESPQNSRCLNQAHLSQVLIRAILLCLDLMSLLYLQLLEEGHPFGGASGSEQ